MNDDNKIINEEDDELNENSELSENIDTQEESMMDESEIGSEAVDESESEAGQSSAGSVGANWIEVKDGKFICSECENESAPETNTVDGTVQADTEQIKADLIERPTKIVYGSCPVCGMEYTFKVSSDALYMEPSDMLK